MFLNFISFITKTFIIYFINIVKVVARCYRRMFGMKKVNNTHLEKLYQIIEKLFLLLFR